jgi:hypothetical protein
MAQVKRMDLCKQEKGRFPGFVYHQKRIVCRDINIVRKQISTICQKQSKFISELKKSSVSS